jgi:hypothetical protein
MAFNFICPTRLESAMTGFHGASETMHRGRLFRVEIHNHGIVCTKDGAPIAWEKLPSGVRKDANAAALIIKDARKLANAQS